MIYTADSIREMERASIRSFVEEQSYQLVGRVLDFGAGKPGTCRQPQPYRDLIAGDYFPYEPGEEFPSGQFDAILSTQVMQYIDNPCYTLNSLHASLVAGGLLIMTYPTTWPEVEASDLWRFTKRGMEALLRAAGFTIDTHVERAAIEVGGMHFALGYGVVAIA